jgi:hypothetical protein
MGFDNADDDIDAGLLPGMSALQHFVGLADPWSSADEDLQPSGFAALAPGCLKQGFRRGTMFKIAALLLSHGGNIILAPCPA